jgi:hypothetical protein
MHACERVRAHVRTCELRTHAPSVDKVEPPLRDQRRHRFKRRAVPSVLLKPQVEVKDLGHVVRSPWISEQRGDNGVKNHPYGPHDAITLTVPRDVAAVPESTCMCIMVCVRCVHVQCGIVGMVVA